jgi:cbb3-type cytochrome oxidase maturation protein
MYFFGWITLVAISLWVSLVAFIWALRSGQFSDQGRARYLPLRDEFSPPRAKHPSQLTTEVYALLFIGGIGLLGLLAPVLLSIYRLKG